VGDSIDLQADASEVGRSRRFCVDLLRGWGAAGIVVDTVELLVSESVTNAVLHARTACHLTIVRVDGGSDGPDRVRVEVNDGDPAPPVTKHYGLEAGSGRGLHLIGVLSDANGCIVTPEGKQVWFEVRWESAPTSEADPADARPDPRARDHDRSS